MTVHSMLTRLGPVTTWLVSMLGFSILNQITREMTIMGAKNSQRLGALLQIVHNSSKGLELHTITESSQL
jgi:hypothetical protein